MFQKKPDQILVQSMEKRRSVKTRWILRGRNMFNIRNPFGEGRNKCSVVTRTKTVIIEKCVGNNCC